MNFEDYYKNSDWFGTYESDLMMKEAFDAGQQSQQAKVEELQKRVETLIQKYKDEDRELKLIDEWEQSQIYGLVVSELEQALKGEGQ
ncbi:hypothetical protein [Acinetobacter baumannii]|uniref:hypothetical protein n=1 Tax=Acinetobacter baumannii TaxID=470 RepID=UPI0015C57489|nr:hypothetical protein [Acinetobacter baumannii]